MNLKNKFGSLLTKYLVERLRFKLLFIFKRFCKPGYRVLDIGCGYRGSLNYNLFNKKINLSLLDVNQGYLEKAKKRYKPCKSYLGWFEKLKIRDKFDIIIFAGVIQYVKNPIKTLEKIHSLLKNNGFLIITTVNKNSFLRKMGIITTKLKKSKNKAYTERRLYTLDELKKLLKEQGFEIISTFGTDRFSLVGADLIIVGKAKKTKIKIFPKVDKGHLKFHKYF